MKKLLFIESSPRGERSYTTKLARALIAELLARDLDWEIDHLRLWHEPLPEMSGAAIDAKYAVFSGAPLSAEQEQAWTPVIACINRFCLADLVVIAVPMWNFGIPYRLKHYIDVVTQPRLTFSWTPEAGYKTLLPPRRAILVTSSGGDYSSGSGMERHDFQLPYLTDWLEIYMGCRVETVSLSLTATDPQHLAAARVDAERLAAELANGF